MIAAVVRAELGFEVVICDTTFDPRMERVREFLDAERPDYVGIGMSTLMLGEGMQAARMAKQRGATVFVGGPHPTVAPAEVMREPAVDACVLGEAETAVVELLRAFEANRPGPVVGCWTRAAGGRVVPGSRSAPIADLDALPFPAWDLVDVNAYMSAWGQLDSYRTGLRGMNVSASRGCPYACTFCQPILNDMFGAKLRSRSPASIVDEIQELERRYAIEGFWFTDDTFSINRKWVAAFCRELTDRGVKLPWGCTTRANLISPELMQAMADAGLRRIGIGMESAAERIREGVYKKGVSLESIEATVRAARDKGVSTLLFLMLGAPDETRAEMLETIEVAARLPADEASFSLFVPIPGTAVHRDMVALGYRMSKDYTDYDYYARQPFEGTVSRRELRWLQWWGYARFYAHPYRWRSMSSYATSAAGVRSLTRKLRRVVPWQGRGTNGRAAR